MHLYHLKGYLEKRAFDFELGEPGEQVAFDDAAERIGSQLPDQVQLFYRHFNGLKVVEPPLRVLPVEELHPNAGDLVRFATFDDLHHVAFDTSATNAAGQWSIVTESTRYEITLTMASFWANKIIKWLADRRQVWLPYHAA